MFTGMETAVYVHPNALCESSRIGEGTRVWAFAHVMDGATVGRDCNIGGNAFIESGVTVGDGVTIKNGVLIWNGVTIEDDVFIGPGAIFTNDRYPRSRRMAEVRHRYDRRNRWLEPTRICRGASIGAHATILCGVTIGPCAMIAAGAIVTRDVPPHQLAAGQPARTKGWVCACGVPLDDALRCSDCQSQYRFDGSTLAWAE